MSIQKLALSGLYDSVIYGGSKYLAYQAAKNISKARHPYFMKPNIEDLGLFLAVDLVYLKFLDRGISLSFSESMMINHTIEKTTALVLGISIGNLIIPGRRERLMDNIINIVIAEALVDNAVNYIRKEYIGY